MSQARRKFVLLAMLLICRYCFVGLAGGLIGGAAALRVLSAQTRPVPERLGVAEVRILTIEEGIKSLQSSAISMQDRINILNGKIDTMEGIGIGLGAIAIVVQLLQAIVSRKLRIPE